MIKFLLANTDLNVVSFIVLSFGFIIVGYTLGFISGKMAGWNESKLFYRKMYGTNRSSGSF